jgi:hypothetical protein
MDAREFHKIYWAAKHPAVRALRDMQPGPQEDAIDLLQRRIAEGFKLASEGHILDKDIDIQFADVTSAPWLFMQQRAALGYTWVPSALQPNIGMAPGVTGPQAPAYDADNPPRGSIKVSVYPADYPPFDPPKPITPAPSDQSPVSGEIYPGMGLNRYHSAPGDNYAIGATWGAYVKRGVAGPFGSSVWWERQ